MTTLTSFYFFVFFITTVVLYYCIPAKNRWIGLLAYSFVFFFNFSVPYTIFYVLVSVLFTHYSSVHISYSNRWSKKTYLLIGVLGNLVPLVALKYLFFILRNISYIAFIFRIPYQIGDISWLAPIGISFYTLQAIGYIVDVYRDMIVPEKNIFKVALFIIYYPLLTSGPIAKYDELCPSLFEGHSFEWKNLTYGLERMLWGVFKKIVISSRLAIIVNAIYSDTVYYDGLYVWIAAALFMLQLYTDFSGCMDIIIGASECYGIILPENFRTPFFSKSVQEFWQRWHISLGRWAKDYIMYPLMRTKAYKKLTKLIKNKCGKNAAKSIPSYCAMLVVWLFIGLWHGGDWKYILGQGLWFWMCIVIEKSFDSFFKKSIRLFRINTACFGYRLFQSIRTFMLIMFGNIFFRMSSITEAFYTIKNGFTNWNPEIMINGDLLKLGLDEKEFRVMILGLFLLLIISILQEKTSIRDRLSRLDIVTRWGLLFILLFSTIILGQYGPGFDSASFIYQGF